MSKPYSQVLDRPVFIMAAPRSGSTLLFETLIKAKDLCSIGDESHGLIEQFSALKPERKSPPSNLLDASDFDVGLREELSKAFVTSLVDSNGRRVSSHSDTDNGDRALLRMIEKTPKNVLRIPFFNALYPDSLFIYLYRNPLENISSIMDGWRSGNFVTYGGLQVAAGRWSFLLPPGWECKRDAKLESMSAWQWNIANESAVEELSRVDKSRIFCLNHDQFLKDTAATVNRLCSFMGINYDDELAEYCVKPLPLSRYTLSRPQHDKWKKNAGQLALVMTETRAVVDKINRFVGTQSVPLSEDWTLASLRKFAKKQPRQTAKASGATTPSRNGPCPCGSGKKYKRCHGALSSAEDLL